MYEFEVVALCRNPHFVYRISLTFKSERRQDESGLLVCLMISGTTHTTINSLFSKNRICLIGDTYILVDSLMYRKPGNKPKVNNEIIYFVTKTAKYFYLKLFNEYRAQH